LAHRLKRGGGLTQAHSTATPDVPRRSLLPTDRSQGLPYFTDSARTRYQDRVSRFLNPETDAHRFFREMVEPTVAEFNADPSSKRRGCLACLVLASMTEHYIHAFSNGTEQNRKTMKKAIRDENLPLGWIADVANAMRHVVRSSKYDAIGFGDIQTMEMGQCGVARCGWPIGGEEVLIGPEHEWRLSELLECVMDFWRSRLNLAG
jgi:hypothetical protein